MYKKVLAFALLLAFVSSVFSQVPAVKDPKKDEGELRKEAVAFLRETMGDVANMRTLENRISFSAELASLMWFHDEREAKSMFNTAIADFRELISQLDARVNVLPEDEEGDVRSGPMRMFGDGSDRAKLEMKLRVAMAVRQQIATSIAEHDPDVALSFFYDTASSDPKAKAMGGSDTHFEFNLLKEIAMKSPAKASQYGMKSLANGLQYQHLDLLKKIAEKDHAVAVEFGSAMLKAAKDTKFKSYELYTFGSLLEFAADNFESSQKPDGKKPIYSQADVREMSELMAKYILEGESEGFGFQYLDTLEKYVPGRVRQIRAKLNPTFPNINTNVSSERAVSTANYSNSMANAYEGSPSSANSTADPKRETEEKLMGDVAKIGTGELPKEEREKVVVEARKILMQNKGKDKQIMGLSMLAAQVAKAGDKELASQIMRDAESLVNPQPKNYQDFLYTWMLVSGYAESDPDKAFLILDGAIGRANDLIHAFVKVGEFIDVTEEMISDGEAQVGAFGGGMIRGLSKELGIAEATLGTLIKADFGKTKAMMNRFDRPEVRVLAKLLVLRSVLGKNATPPSSEEQVKKAMGQN